jgi:SAM-dependent methyltransferase
MNLSQAEIDQKNAAFWNELCGSALARQLGITDHSLDSLHKFDDYYFSFYPDLLPIIGPQRMRGKKVLEIGLGYGSLGQQIAAAGANYTGLDIAQGPVEMTKHRLHLQGLPGHAVCGSALEMPFPAGSFDFVVAIGCFHHTGDVQRCIDESYRVLREGGTLVFMVYNKFSLRHWKRWPWQTFKALCREVFRGADRPETISAERRSAHDLNHAGVAAPETVLLSKKELRKMLCRFEQVAIQKQNADPLMWGNKVLIDRPRLLGNVGRILGLHHYVEARKSASSQQIEFEHVPPAKAA